MDPDDYDMLMLEMEQDNAISRRKARKKAKELAAAQNGDWEECVAAFAERSLSSSCTELTSHCLTNLFFYLNGWRVQRCRGWGWGWVEDHAWVSWQANLLYMYALSAFFSF